MLFSYTTGYTLWLHQLGFENWRGKPVNWWPSSSGFPSLLARASYSYTALNLITWNYTLKWMRTVTEWKDYQPIFDSLSTLPTFPALSGQPIAGRFRMQNADFALERPKVVGARPRLVRTKLGRAGLSKSFHPFWERILSFSNFRSHLWHHPCSCCRRTLIKEQLVIVARNRLCIAKFF